MWWQLLRKLRRDAGESIAETLIALLISSLALLMLAGAITAAARVIERSKTATEAYYLADNALVKYESNVGTGQITIHTETNEISQPFYNVYYYLNDKLGGIDVYTYDASSSISTLADP